MLTDTITKAVLAQEINNKIGFSEAEAQEMVNTILNIMVKELSKGQEVSITNFGKFEIKNKQKRIGRNPKTMIEFPINERNVIRFVISKKFKEQINKSARKIANAS